MYVALLATQSILLTNAYRSLSKPFGKNYPSKACATV